MRFFNALITLPFICFFSASATPADDMRKSAMEIGMVSTVLDNSLNNSMAVNTSSMVQALVWQIGASIANLGTYNGSSSQPNATTPAYDVPYFNYIDSVLTLSEALIRRGQAPHAEPNLPVYTALQGLYNVIQSYGFQLDNANEISTSATIRTLTAGNSIVDAESIWARNTTVTQTSRRRNAGRDVEKEV